jgi:hypothetical protein
MKRPLGIVLSAIVLSLAALFLLLMAAVLVAVTFFANHQPSPALALPHSAIYLFLAVSIVYTGLAVWAILTIIGIVRLRSWARYSILIIGGGLAAIGASCVFGTILGRVLHIFPTQQPGVDPRLMTITLVVMTTLYALVAGIGVWWLIYFNLRTTRELFLNPALLALSPDGVDRGPTGAPIAIKILGYLFLFGTLCFIILTFLPFPVFFCGFVFPGKASHLLYLALGLVWALAGYGLLRLKESARRLTIAILVFGCFNALLAFLPWYQERLRQYAAHLTSMTPDMAVQPAPINYTGSMMITYGLFGLILNLFALWLLHRHRSAFIPPAATMKPIPNSVKPPNHLTNT